MAYNALNFIDIGERLDVVSCELLKRRGPGVTCHQVSPVMSSSSMRLMRLHQTGRWESTVGNVPVQGHMS